MNKGGRGYEYITVDEDEAANVLFCNNTLMHLSSDQIPKAFGVRTDFIFFTDSRATRQITLMPFCLKGPRYGKPGN